MERVAIFTEGQSEQIFVRNLLMKLIDNTNLSFECLRLLAGELLTARFNFASPSATVHFMLIDVGNDGKVTGVIKERELGLWSAGYKRIVGLRDMYCEAYDKRARGKIREEVSREIEQGIAQRSME